MDVSVRASGPEPKLENAQAVELKTEELQALTQLLRFSFRLQLPQFGAAPSPPLPSLLRGDTFQT